MRIDFPESNKVYLQNNRSNVYPKGNLWSTFNVDLQSNVGVLRISPRLRINSSTTTDADLGCPVAFKYFDTRIWALCDTHIFWNTGEPDDTPFTDDASTGFQTTYTADYSDMETFNNSLCATTQTGLYSKGKAGDGTGSWTARDTLTSGTSHMMTYFKRFNRLYYLNAGNAVLSIDSNWSTADPSFDYALDLSAPNNSNIPTCIQANNDFVWIGMSMNGLRGAPGKIYQWDGISQQINVEYELNNASAVMAIAIDPEHDNPFVMDSNGVLSAWNGGGFTEVGRLPIPLNVRLPYNTGDSSNARFIHPNGMYFTRNGTVRCNINNRANTGDVIENLASGLWEWSKENGFVHIEPFTYNVSTSGSIRDWGQNRVVRVGAVSSMNIASTNAVDGTILVGATIYTDATATTSAIFIDNSLDTIQKKGYVVTDWFESKDVASSWGRFWVSYRRFIGGAEDNITVKYRSTEEAPVDGTITWVDSRTFTVANSAVVVSNYWTANTGGEVEILRGDGGGACAHITNAVLATGTWTVTLDEAINPAATTNTATGRFQKWVKLFSALPLTSPTNYAQFSIDTISTPRIQLKLCFTYTGQGEFYKGVIISTEDIKATQ